MPAFHAGGGPETGTPVGVALSEDYHKYQSKVTKFSVVEVVLGFFSVSGDST